MILQFSWTIYQTKQTFTIEAWHLQSLFYRMKALSTQNLNLNNFRVFVTESYLTSDWSYTKTKKKKKVIINRVDVNINKAVHLILSVCDRK